MKKVVAFVQARITLFVSVAIVVVGSLLFFSWYQNQNGSEQLLSVEPKPFVQSVSVSGRVVPIDAVDLAFIQGGRIADVFVSVGEQVSQGNVLAHIENGDARALVLQRKAALAAAEADLQSLLDGARPEEIAVSEAAVISAEVALAQSLQAFVEEVQDAYRTADNAVRVEADQLISDPHSNPQLSFNTSNAQAEATVESQRVALEAVLNTWELEVFALTTSSNLEGALEGAQNNLSQVASFLVAVNAAANQGVATGSVTESALETYAADVASARSAVNTAIAALTTAETSKKSAAASLTSAQKSLTLKKAGPTATAIASEEAQVVAAQAQVLDAEAQLRKTSIRAPFSGVITRVDAEIGEVASAQTPVISLISEGVFHIESFVPEINIALLEVGDSARVTLDAYGESVFFDAAIVSLDPAETLRDGVSTYRATLEFVDENDARIKAGMTANVLITTEEKQDVIAVPQGIIIAEAGKTYVLVKVNEVIEKREVVTGIVSSLGEIEILEGLVSGDAVILSQ